MGDLLVADNLMICSIDRGNKGFGERPHPSIHFRGKDATILLVTLLRRWQCQLNGQRNQGVFFRQEKHRSSCIHFPQVLRIDFVDVG